MNNTERQQKILDNKKLVYKVLKDYNFIKDNNFEDYFQEGVIGLIEAVDSYKSQPCTFSQYAYWRISKKVLNAKFQKYNYVRIPNHVYDIRSRVSNYLQKKYGINEDYLTEKEYIEKAKEINIKENKSKLVYNKFINTTYSTLNYDLESNDRNPDDKIYIDEMMGKVKKIAINYMPSRWRKILNLKYGLEGEEPHSENNIALIYGISNTAINDVVQRAIKRLRDRFKSKGITHYEL